MFRTLVKHHLIQNDVIDIGELAEKPPKTKLSRIIFLRNSRKNQTTGVTKCTAPKLRTEIN